MAAPSHLIWGRPELVSSESDSLSLGRESRDRSADEIKRAVLEKLMQDVTLNSDSGELDVPPGKNDQVTNRAIDKLQKQGRTGEGDDKDGDDNDEEEMGEGQWSVGSVLHSEGKCRPCHYYNTKTSCQNGEGCSFCHLAHPKRFRPRPCKPKRSKCKRLAGMLDAALLQDDPEKFDSTVNTLAAKGGYLKSVVQSKARTIKSEQQAVPVPKPNLLSL
mmetsp:Transcript_36193/g.65675  ORF Transcript_36193/g.65675 Transcript_36193/m.65675 type:complete len:217 (+) Transcript_36193:64-714(+)